LLGTDADTRLARHATYPFGGIGDLWVAGNCLRV